jgi:hypothetical protein
MTALSAGRIARQASVELQDKEPSKLRRNERQGARALTTVENSLGSYLVSS